MKKGLCIFLVALLALFGLTGCEKKPSNDGILARVNDREVTVGYYEDIYNYYLVNQQIDETDEANAETVQNLKQEVVQLLVNEAVQLELAKEKGITVSEADEVDLKAQLEETYTAWRDYFKQQMGDEASLMSDEELAKALDEDVANYVQQTGYTDEYMLQSLKDNLILERLYDEYGKTVEPTEEEVRAKYDELVEYQRASYEGNVSQFEANATEGDIFYALDGHKVRHILIAFDYDKQVELTELRKTDEEAANKKRDEYAADIVDSANSVLEAVQIGGADNFDQLMQQYSSDSAGGVYTVARDSSTFAQEFKDGAWALTKLHEISGLVLSDFGYHILILDEIYTEGPVEYELVRQQIYDYLLESSAQTIFSDLILEARNRMTVEVFPENVGLPADSFDEETEAPVATAPAGAATAGTAN